jgi:hypothetical protein
VLGVCSAGTIPSRRTFASSGLAVDLAATAVLDHLATSFLRLCLAAILECRLLLALSGRIPAALSLEWPSHLTLHGLLFLPVSVLPCFCLILPCTTTPTGATMDAFPRCKELATTVVFIMLDWIHLFCPFRLHYLHEFNVAQENGTWGPWVHFAKSKFGALESLMLRGQEFLICLAACLFALSASLAACLPRCCIVKRACRQGRHSCSRLAG